MYTCVGGREGRNITGIAPNCVSRDCACRKRLQSPTMVMVWQINFCSCSVDTPPTSTRPSSPTHRLAFWWTSLQRSQRVLIKNWLPHFTDWDAGGPQHFTQTCRRIRQRRCSYSSTRECDSGRRSGRSTRSSTADPCPAPARSSRLWCHPGTTQSASSWRHHADAELKKISFSCTFLIFSQKFSKVNKSSDREWRLGSSRKTTTKQGWCWMTDRRNAPARSTKVN